MATKRVPMQVAPEFEIAMKKIQSEIMKGYGKLVSLRELTGKVVTNPDFDALEKALINRGNRDIGLNFDRRRR